MAEHRCLASSTVLGETRECYAIVNHKGDHMWDWSEGLLSRSYQKQPIVSSPQITHSQRHQPIRSRHQRLRKRLLREARARQLLLAYSYRLEDLENPRSLSHRLSLWLHTLAVKSLVARYRRLPESQQKLLMSQGLAEEITLASQDHQQP